MYSLFPAWIGKFSPTPHDCLLRLNTAQHDCLHRHQPVRNKCLHSEASANLDAIQYSICVLSSLEKNHYWSNTWTHHAVQQWLKFLHRGLTSKLIFNYTIMMIIIMCRKSPFYSHCVMVALERNEKVSFWNMPILNELYILRNRALLITQTSVMSRPLKGLFHYTSPVTV